MRLGLYTFASLALIGLVAAVVYTLNLGNYTLAVDSINFTLALPVAVWVVFPMFLLFIATVFHMMYHGAKNYFFKRKWMRDANELQDAVYWSLLKEPKEHNYVIPEMKMGASLLSVSSLSVHDSVEGLSDKLGKTVTWIKKIENGTYIDLKEKKVAKFLSIDNPLVVQNELNHLKNDSSFADTILQNRGLHSQAVSDAALNLLVAKENFRKLSSYLKEITIPQLEIMYGRADAGEEVGLDVAMAEELTKTIDMRCHDYMRLARSTIKKLTPDENLALFKQLSGEKDAAQNAYLYLLFQYEMLDAAALYLDEFSEDDFVAYRALLTLKQGQHAIRLRDIISSATVCDDA